MCGKWQHYVFKSTCTFSDYSVYLFRGHGLYHDFCVLLNQLFIISYLGMKNDNTYFIFKNYSIVMLVNFMKTKMYNSNIFDYLKQFLTSLGSQLEFMSIKYKVSFGLKTMMFFILFCYCCFSFNFRKTTNLHRVVNELKSHIS